MVEYTDNGMEYTWQLAGPDGAAFVLFPSKEHTKEDIKEAKRSLRYSRDVVTLRVANIYDLIDRYWTRVFHVAEKQHKLHWSQIDCDNKLMAAAIRKNTSVVDYVEANVDKWKSNPIKDLYK